MHAYPTGTRGCAENADYQLSVSWQQSAAAAPLLFGCGLSADAAAGKGQLVLVVGATGGIGQFACYDLLQRGYKVLQSAWPLTLSSSTRR